MTKETVTHVVTVQETVKPVVSKWQIELLREITPVGISVNFKRDSEEISGIVTKKYPNIFFLDDGRCYTWTDYILGNPFAWFTVSAILPMDEIIEKSGYRHEDRNLYSYRMQRYK